MDWLNPPDVGGADDQTRTLTTLYNNPSTWLQHLHDRLDAAVATAYGWSSTLSEEEVLSNLLSLNHARSNPAALSTQEAP
jgi:hypothetical protein